MNQVNSLEKWLLLIIKISCLLALAVPLVVVRNSFFPYIMVKTIIFRMIIEIAFFSWLWLIIRFPKYRPKATGLFWAITIFLAFFLISTLTSASFLKSFWGNPERMGGFFTFLHYYLFWLVIVNSFNKVKDWYLLLRTSLLVSLLIAGYSIGQYLHLGFTIGDSTRVNSTIGNAAYLASYLLFHIYFAWYFLIRAEKQLVKYGYFIVSLILMCSLFLTATRGAQLAFFVSLIILLIFSVIFKFFTKKTARILIIFSLVILCSAFLVFIVRKTSLVTGNYYLSRFTQVSLTDATFKTRLNAWQAGWQGFKERPLFGYGPENYNIAFNKYLSAEFYSYTSSEIWFDRAHNTIFDILVMYGLFGLISYLTIYFLTFKVIWRFFKQHGYVESSALLGLIFIAHFLQNLFVFDSLTTYLTLFLVLGFVGYLERTITSAGPKSKILSAFQSLKARFFSVKEKKPITVKVHPWISGSLIVVAVVVLFSAVNLREIRANKLIYQSLISLNKTDSASYYNVRDDFRKSIETALNPVDFIDLALEGFPKIALGTRQISAEQKINDLNQLIGLMDRALVADPLNAYNYSIYAKFYLTIYEITKNKDDLENALKVINLAKKLAPNRLDLLYLEAQIYGVSGELDKALPVLDRAIELNQSQAFPYWFKFLVYQKFEDSAKAYESAKLAIEYNFKFNKEDLEKIIPLFKDKADKDGLISIYEILIGLEPQNIAYYQELNSLYLELGNNAQAELVRKRIEELENKK